MHSQNERGIALVLALFLMSALSVLGASLMFLSQTETYASMNYRMMSQARYAAEAGIQKASNFLLDPNQFPTPTVADVLGPGCVRTVSPVTCGGQEVILSASASKASTYPVLAVRTAFNAAGQGTLVSGNLTLTFGSYARLLNVQTFQAYGGGQGVTETWEVVADGGLAGSPKATVEVLALIETPKVPASSYAAFATDIMCGALSVSGSVDVKSYDSSQLTGGTAPDPTHGETSTGGDVGTNGNLTITGSAEVGGKLFTPRTGIGACTNGANGAIDGLTEGGHASVDGGMVKLPAALVYPTPQLPGPSPLTDVSGNAVTCAGLGLPVANCTETTSGSDRTITIDSLGLTTPLVMPSIKLTAHTNLRLTARNPSARYDFNSIELQGGATIGLNATSSNQGVLLGIIGKDPSGTAIATPVDLTGGSQVLTGCGAGCSDYDASLLQMVYAGTGELKVGGTNDTVMTVYAPNALFTLSGTGNVYGSILSKRLNDIGNGDIKYDRRLLHDYWVVGNPIVGTFSWQRY